jgi:GxxExxY protein
LPILYKDVQLTTIYRVALICYYSIIVELKAIRTLTDLETSQVIHYLKATKHSVDLLLNLGTKSLEFKRYANDLSAKSA